jgi:fructose/tagatose bisphosphate aldolase
MARLGNVHGSYRSAPVRMPTLGFFRLKAKETAVGGGPDMRVRGVSCACLPRVRTTT